MGRRRTTDLDLPPRLYRRASSYYYVASDGKWHNLGRDRGRALRLWAELDSATTGSTVADIVHHYLDYLDAEGCQETVAGSTRKKYGSYARTIAAKFGGTAADSLTVPTLARWRDSGEVKPVWFNGCLAVLRSAYRKGGEWGFVTTNAPKDVGPNPTEARRRYIGDAEFRAIREKSTAWLQVAMDVSYLTGMREGDILALRWNAVSDRVYVEQEKTGNRQAFEISAALRAVLEGAKRRPIVGLFVVATDKGRPITGRRLQKAWAKACAAAWITDARFHDIRGKAATDAADEGMDYQAMLGHSSRKMSDRYVKSRRTVNAPSHKRRV